ncbi:CCA tRNA nucleotidyltransferase [Phenylobacterium immobile]|uniref:CCA tRNA nucleotidyltransferase n=1 Tax=Phenylobacterium immobile TaxID=21 RepID=UPI000B2DF81E|nr:CCA tRNA nucleotidyltransferase [Phenylobacterium immobile]
MIDPAPNLAGAAWLDDAATVAVMDALEAAGGPDCARFVGGCVRNAIIAQPISDIDIATILNPDQTIAALRRAGVRAVPTGVEHGTVTAVWQGRPVEVTTLRRDVETDGRRAVVAFTQDWAEDARRRDFTLNSLYALRDGTIFDPTGRGVADARAGRIVFVGDPAQRLAEDYLRALRFFRFYAWYGQGEADRAALQACAAVADRVASLAAERIWAEFKKLLAAENPQAAVRLMAEAGVLAAVIGDGASLAHFAALASQDPLLRFAALIPAGQTAALAQRLRLSRAERDRLVAAAAGPPFQVGEDPRAAIYRLGTEVFKDRALLAQAAGRTDMGAAAALAATWTPPRFPLGGEDALAAGVPRGPAVGAALRAVEEDWIAGGFSEDRAGLLARLRSAV